MRAHNIKFASRAATNAIQSLKERMNCRCWYTIKDTLTRFGVKWHGTMLPGRRQSIRTYFINTAERAMGAPGTISTAELGRQEEWRIEGGLPATPPLVGNWNDEYGQQN